MQAQAALAAFLQDELFSVDDDGVAGVMSAGVARDYGKTFREDVDNFSFAFVAPLRADNYCCLASFQYLLRNRDLGTHHSAAHAYHTPWGRRRPAAAKTGYFTDQTH
jgi:hypothetical protein